MAHRLLEDVEGSTHLPSSIGSICLPKCVAETERSPIILLGIIGPIDSYGY